MATNNSEITEGLLASDLRNPFDFHVVSHVKSSIQLRYVSSKTSIIARALRYAIVDLLDHISENPHEYRENETTVMGTEHRLYNSRHYKFKLADHELQCSDLNDNDHIDFEISSLAPTVFHKLRKDVGISHADFRQSFSKYNLKDFTNPGRSGSLMYKTFDDLFILKTIRSNEAHLLMQILSGYHLQLVQRPTLLNRFVGLYSLRFPALISTVELYVVIMINVFTSSLKINEIFDLKGSTIKRKLTENLSIDKLYKLKDLDFTDLYPYGICIPTKIYQQLHLVISNDVKVLKKLHITDFSLILGIRHLDMSEDDLMQRRPSTGIAALLHMGNTIALLGGNISHIHVSTENSSNDLASLSISYLKPLAMIDENIDKNLFYDDDSIAYASLPIPGIVNKTNQRVYLYLAIIDTLQTYDHFKCMEQKLKQITDPSRHLQYSVVEPDEYEKRIMRFLFQKVFIDAGDDFPWTIRNLSKPVGNIDNQSIANNKHMKKKRHTHTRPHSIERENSTIEFRL